MKNIIVLLVLLVGLRSHAQHDLTTFHFTENIGQLDSKVKYHSKIHVGDVYLENNKFVFDMFSGDELDAYYKVKHDNENRKSISDNSRTTESELLKPFNKHAYSMTFVGANQNPSISPSDKIEGYKNYFIGDDESKWVSGVKSFRTIEYGDLYDNIDMEIYTVFERMKYDFIVKPGGNPNNISVKYDNVESIEIIEGGLVIHLTTGDVKEMKPVAYQKINGTRTDVPCKFILKGTTLSFELPEGYDNSEQLIIDPTWIFSTLTGSASDNWGFTATYDTTGALYSGGIAFGNSYPTVGGSYQTAFAGGNIDIVISKFSPNGTTLLFSTYLGGTNNEMPHSLVNDSQNNLVLLASTGSSNFPTTVGAYNTSFNAGINVTYSNGVQYSSGCDIAIVKFNSTGSALLASTFVGGSGNDGANESFVYNYADEVRGEVVVDAIDNIYITTSTWSTDFPTIAGVYSQTNLGDQDAVVVKMSSDLTTMDWGTYLGGSNSDAGYSIRIAPNNDVYICGGTVSTNLPTSTGAVNETYGGNWDGFIARLENTDGSLTAMTYIGTGDYDQTFILEVDNSGDVYTIGQSLGAYPIVNAAYSIANSAQFIHKLSPDLTTTIYSTIFGSGSLSGPANQQVIDIAPTAFLVDNCGNVYVSGWGGNSNNEGSTDNMPISGDAQQPSTDGSDFYFFVMERDAQSLLYGSYFGSTSANEHVDGGTSRFDKAGNVYQAVCAGCGGNSFPTTPGVYSTTNGSSNCNLGAIKFGFDFQGVEAQANVPANIILCSTDYTVNFTSSGTAPEHEWDFGDGSAASFVADPTHTYATVGNYVVRYIAFDPNSCNLRDTIYFDVELIQAPTFNASFTLPDIPPCSDPTVVYVDAEITGTGIDSTQWNMGDGIIYTDDLVISHEYLTEGIYPIEVIAWDLTCNISDTIRDTLNFITAVSTATANAPADTTLCSQPPFSMDFTSDGSSPDVFWDFGDGNTSILEDPSNLFADSGSYNIMFVAIDSSTCNIADTVYFNVDLLQAPTFSATINVPVIPPCTDPLLTPLSASFTGSGADSLSWDLGDGTIYPDSTGFTYFYTSPGVYTVTLTAWDFVCNNTNTISEIVNFNSVFSVATATAPEDTTLCSQPPFSMDFTSDGSSPDVFWDFGDGNTSILEDPSNLFADSGSYNIMFVAIDSSTCNIADTVYFNVDLLQAPTFSADFDLPIIPPCSDPSSVTVNINILGTGIDSTHWDMGDGTTFEDSIAISYNYTNTGIYNIILTAWDYCGGDTSIYETFNFITDSSLAVASAPEDTTLCTLPPFSIGFTSSGTTAGQFWDFGDGNTSTDVNPTNTFLDSGTYVVTYIAIDSSTCNIADTAYFNVNLIQAEQFSAEINFTPPPPCGGDSMLVELDFSGTAADSLIWDMGNGDVFYADSVAYYYTEAGIYNLSLTAFDFTCNLTEVISSEVPFFGNISTDVIIPNVFTPNGDGENDLLTFVNVSGSETYSLTIWNRWGKKVFVTDDALNHWDGTNKNDNSIHEGVYYYEILFTDKCSDKEQLKTGFVHLMR